MNFRLQSKYTVAEGQQKNCYDHYSETCVFLDSSGRAAVSPVIFSGRRHGYGRGRSARVL